MAKRKPSDPLLSYFVAHFGRVDNWGRQAVGDAISSGSVEWAANTLGLRLMARGPRWRRKNVRAMAARVCCRHSGQ